MMKRLKSSSLSCGQGAYTLIEMLWVLGLLILCLMGAFSVMPMYLSKQLSFSMVRDIEQLLSYARYYALVVQKPVLVCDWSYVLARCHPRIAHQLAVVVGHTVLNVLAFSPLYRVFWRGNLGHNQALVFLPTGMSEGQNGRFSVCPRQAKDASPWSVYITQQGRIRVARDAASRCNIERV